MNITIIGTGYVGLVTGVTNTLIIFDTRNQYNPCYMKQLGIEYVSVSRLGERVFERDIL